MVSSTPAHAQRTDGNLYGRVTDNQGERLPGVTVTLTGHGAPQVQVTNAEGEFRFLGLAPGQYSMTSELEGFSTVDYPTVAIGVGRNTTIEVGLSPAVEEVITVTSESPLLDARKISTGVTVSQIELEKIPSARDPWAVLQTVPGVQTDRINVGGNESGQQSQYTGPGSEGDDASWSVDGVVITDPAARGASPTYYDFDAFEEKDRFTYFTPGYYGSLLSPGALTFPGSAFTLGSIQSAPAGRGVQDVGLEISIPYDERYAPGGAVGSPRGSEPDGEPLLYVVARGGSTGEVYDVVIVHPPEGRVAIDGVVVIEPVAATAADRQRFERELARAPGEREMMTAAGYCLELDRTVPPPGTVYRVAPAAKQARYEPMRRALEAASRVRDAGGLDPDSDPTDYYHSIRQWAVWSVEKGFDRAGFLDAFTERTEKNFREAGQPWSPEVADAVRAYSEGRWKDIREVLDTAGAAPCAACDRTCGSLSPRPRIIERPARRGLTLYPDTRLLNLFRERTR